jgi:valyl-tRNA synthetase
VSEYRIDQAKGEIDWAINRSSYSNSSSVFVRAFDDVTYETAENGIQAITSLSGKGVASIKILAPSAPIPTGCAVFVVSATVAVFLEVKGRVDLEEEINKAQNKLKKAADGAARQRKVLNDGDFLAKVSPAVQEIEKSRLDEFLAQERNYEKSIEQFQQLKLAG